MIKQSRGFSLVELMVAMVVSLVVILGAGQLFISLSQTSQRITLLSEKQAAVNFAVETLLRDIRRADWEYYNDGAKPDHHPNTPWNASDNILSLYVPNRGDVSSSSGACSLGDMILKHYMLVDREVAGETIWFIAVNADECRQGNNDWSSLGGGGQELVGGFLSPQETTPGPGFYVGYDNWGDGVVKVTLRLVPTDDDATPDTLTFYAVNRTAVFN